MPITSYSQLDLTSIAKSKYPSGPYADVLLGISDSGVGFVVDAFGSDATNTPPVGNDFIQAIINGAILSANVDHSSPVNPIPTDAIITKVELIFQVSYHVDASGSFTDGAGGNPAQCTSDSAYHIEISSLDAFNIWITSGTPFLFDLGDFENFPANGSGSSAAAIGPAGSILNFTLDFSLNPGGAFPSGFMTYSQFLANFSALSFFYKAGGNVGALVSNPPAASISDSILTVFQMLNFAMDVTWNVPFAWTIDPADLILPDNVITLSRPEVPIDGDNQQLETIYINGHPIKPNDPWVIIWLRFLIIIHLIIKFPDDPDDTILIEADPIGTEFSGRVPLGSITVTYTDLSGIYTFDTTVHHDVLYDRTDTESPTTVNVLIPAPFFVTAFVDDGDIEVLHYTGTRMRVTGAGLLKQVFQSLDYINTEQLIDTTLRTSGNLSPFVLANFIDQNASLRVYMDQLDDFMNVSKIVIFSKALYTGYPQ